MYIKKVENFLGDQSKFQKTAVKDENFVNFLLQVKKNALIKFIKSLLTLTACPKKHEDI